MAHFDVRITSHNISLDSDSTDVNVSVKSNSGVSSSDGYPVAHSLTPAEANDALLEAVKMDFGQEHTYRLIGGF